MLADARFTESFINQFGYYFAVGFFFPSADGWATFAWGFPLKKNTGEKGFNKNEWFFQGAPV